MSKILVGCDPELFVFHGVTNAPVSAHDLIPGTKRDPFKVPLGAIQVDGVATEFNIEPAATREQFRDNIYMVRNNLARRIREKNPEFILRATPTVKFTRKMWQKIPDTAKELGCEPDYNAYTGEANPKPSTNKFMRTGSGHIHVSWGDILEGVTPERFDECIELVKHFDMHLLPNAEKWDNDKERMELYGKPGAFRPKPYGVEYRVLSNAWLDNWTATGFVYDTVVECTKNWLEGAKPGDYRVQAFQPFSKVE